jgi:hypothetical protein
LDEIQREGEMVNRNGGIERKRKAEIESASHKETEDLGERGE